MNIFTVSLYENLNMPARTIMGNGTAIEAVTSYVQSIIEDAGGEWMEGPVQLYQRGGQKLPRLFDIAMTEVPAQIEGGSSSEYECEIEITERD